MNTRHPGAGVVSELDRYLERTSALELARRSLVGAPVYAVVSLIILFGTPILADYGIWAIVEASLLVLLGGLRVWFALSFESRYARFGERAVVQFSILTALQSLTFGVMAAMVVWQYWATQEAVLTVVLAAGCIAAGTSALSVRRSAHFIFLVCVLAPLCTAVFLVGGLTKALLILGFLMLMALLVQDGGQARRLYLEHLRTRFEAEIGERRADIERQARKDFFEDIGHEIRTPVTCIIGMTKLLEKEVEGSRAREFLEIIRQSSDSLVKLVDDIPGAVRTRPDIRKSASEAIDLGARLRKVMQLYEPQANGKGVELIAQLDDLPAAVRIGDADYLEQVMVNLLDNALTHTANGSVTVSATCSRQAGAGEELMFEIGVADTGAGIPPDQLQFLFKTSDDSGVRVSGRYGGRGLGLPICKGLVELLGGDIRVDSTEGEGTRVTFTLRARLDAAAAAWQPPAAIMSESRPWRQANLSRDFPHRILVVEDHPANRRILCEYLAGLGYPVDEAADGETAVAAAMENEYDLIFMDLRMPNMNGMEATRWIRQKVKGNQNVRIIALSGDASYETREECFEAGMDDFVPKPISPEGLEAILRNPIRAAA